MEKKLGDQQTQTSEKKQDKIKEKVASDKKAETQETKFVRVVTPKDEKRESKMHHSKLGKGKL